MSLEIYCEIIGWALMGILSWIYAYSTRQFLEEREFAVMPMYMVGGFASFMCLVIFWMISKRGDKLVKNPFFDFHLHEETID